MIKFTKTSDDILLQYGKLQDSSAHLVAIAAHFLSLAIIVKQAPDDTANRAAAA